jgi:hypothetical protein
MMTDDDCDFFDEPLKLDDYTEMTVEVLEQAVDRLDAGDVRRFIASVRKKLDEIERDAEPDEPQPERRDRWWDR